MFWRLALNLSSLHHKHRLLFLLGGWAEMMGIWKGLCISGDSPLPGGGQGLRAPAYSVPLSPTITAGGKVVAGAQAVEGQVGEVSSSLIPALCHPHLAPCHQSPIPFAPLLPASLGAWSPAFAATCYSLICASPGACDPCHLPSMAVLPCCHLLSVMTLAPELLQCSPSQAAVVVVVAAALWSQAWGGGCCCKHCCLAGQGLESQCAGAMTGGMWQQEEAEVAQGAGAERQQWGVGRGGTRQRLQGKGEQ